MNAAQAYAAAVDALQAARRARRDALRHCENYEAGEDADPSDRYPGSPGYAACFWDGERARADWCEACAARTDLGDWKALKREKARAQAEVLRAGRAGADVDIVARTSVALVKARDEVRRLRAERAACICDFEERPPAKPWGNYLPPLRVRGPEWDDIVTAGKKRIDAKTAPCWAVIESDDAPMTEFGKITQYEQIGDSAGFCPSCEQRNVLHAAYRAARRRVVALTSGHLNATRAHMRRTGELPPTPPKPARPKVEAPKPPQPLPLEEGDDAPF